MSGSLISKCYVGFFYVSPVLHHIAVLVGKKLVIYRLDKYKKEVNMAPNITPPPPGPGQNTCDKSSLNRETYKKPL